MVSCNLSPLHRISSRERRGVNISILIKLMVNIFFQKLNQQLFNDLPNVMNNIVRVIIASLNEKFLTEIVDVMNDRLNKGI